MFFVLIKTLLIFFLIFLFVDRSIEMCSPGLQEQIISRFWKGKNAFSIVKFCPVALDKDKETHILSLWSLWPHICQLRARWHTQKLTLGPRFSFWRIKTLTFCVVSCLLVIWQFKVFLSQSLACSRPSQSTEQSCETTQSSTLTWPSCTTTCWNKTSSESLNHFPECRWEHARLRCI